MRGEVDGFLADAHQIRVKAVANKPPEEDDVMTLDTNAELLRIGVHGTTERLFEALHQRKEKIEHSYFIFSLMSYLTIAFGFALSLTGHLIARDDEIPEVQL